MPAISFNSVLIIAGIAVLVPVVLGLVPQLPVPGAVLEVIAGIVVGPPRPRQPRTRWSRSRSS